jgi:hypothetical protein
VASKELEVIKMSVIIGLLFTAMVMGIGMWLQSQNRAGIRS